MFAQIIYIEGHKKSEESANRCLTSCDVYGYSASKVQGITPITLPIAEEKYKLFPLTNSRAWDYETQNQPYLKTKKSCFLNHVIFWEKVVTTNDIGIFLEHDALATTIWDDPNFTEVLCLNMKSAFDFNRNLNKDGKGESFTYKNTLPRVLRDMQSKLVYLKNNLFKGAILIPGTAAYAITPKGAERLLKSLKINGWDQSDFFINTKNVNIQYADPDYFKFNGENLKTSLGF